MKITNTEWQVMRIIWANDGSTSREIMNALAKKFEWTPSTVKTLLSRLVEKGCLTTKKTGNKFSYFAVLTEAASVNQIVEDINEKTCATKLPALISDLIAQHQFTLADLNQLEVLIQAKKNQAVESVESVACDCVQCACDTCDK